MKFLTQFINPFVAYAAETSSGFPSGFTELIGYVVGISAGLAVVSAAVCLIRIMVASDPSEIAEAKDNLKQIGIAFVTISAIWAVVAFAMELADVA